MANGSKVNLPEKATHFFFHSQFKIELGMKYLYECSVGFPVQLLSGAQQDRLEEKYSFALCL